ncbi:hypothetical protein [Halocynthiibacter sp.]|uniref:hypothetical protein n=1 Tax=Halocynthiibacter sp. TaxID=1979210 RepID=UPI003C4C65E2
MNTSLKLISVLISFWITTLSAQAQTIIPSGSVSSFQESHNVYEVLVIRDDFMPPNIYLQDGDAISFKNYSTSSTRYVRANNGSWQTYAIPPNGRVVVQFNSGAERRFYSANQYGNRINGNTGDIHNGKIIWGTAPND